MTEENPAAERVYKQRQAVAKEFKLDFDDWRVKRLALLMSVHAAAEDQIANGKLVDVSALLSLDKAIEDIRQSIKATEPLSISVPFVQGVTGVYKCSKCGHKNELEDGTYTPRKTGPRAPTTIDAKAEPVAETKPEPAKALPAPPAPPKPVELSPAWQAFNRQQGYGTSARDGGPIKGPAMRNVSPMSTLTNGKA
jgi:hypothetical protein